MAKRKAARKSAKSSRPSRTSVHKSIIEFNSLTFLLFLVFVLAVALLLVSRLL